MKAKKHLLEVEACVLGTLIAHEKASASALEVLSENVFTTAAHKAIYKAAKGLSMRFEPIDTLTLANELGKNGDSDAIEEKGYLKKVLGKAASKMAASYVAMLKEAHLRRELKVIVAWLQEKIEDETQGYADINRELERKIYRLKESAGDECMHPIKTALGKVIKQMENTGNTPEGISGIPSGFSALDRITNGWVKGSITILGGRPAMGKTSLLLDIARRVAVEFDMPVAYFSLELSVTQVTQRMMSSLSGIETRHLQIGKVTSKQWDTLHDSMDGLSKSQLFIDDTANLSLFEFREKCRVLKANANIELVLVDHIQLMKHSERRMQNRDRELSEICKGLKGIARELDIAIVASSQLSRAVETRGGDKRPMLSDLRESGALEQDADLVLFLYRPEYYGITEDWNGKDTEGIAEVIVSKNRFGPMGTAELKFDNRTSSFSELKDNDDDSAFDGVRVEDFF